VDGKIYEITLLTPRGEHVIEAAEDEHLWDAAHRAGLMLPAICHQGRCLTCAGRLEAPGDFESSDATYYYPVDREARYILLCTSKARSNLKIRTHQQHEMRKFRRQHNLPAPYS
jgi:ferredoxin